MSNKTTIAWMTYFPVAWRTDLPPEFSGIPRGHPAPWERVLLDEFKQRDDLNLHIIAVDKTFPRSLTFEREGVTFHCLKVPPFRMASLFWPETLRIRRLLRAINPHLLHAWGMERGAALVASRMGYPHLVTAQGLLSWSIQIGKKNLYVTLEAKLEPASMRRASFVTAESSFALKWLANFYPHLMVLQVEHAPDPLFFHVPRNPSPQTPVQFLHVGRATHLKGTDLLIQALDQLRTELNFHLTLVTTPAGDYLKELRKSSSSELWERITLKENLSPEEIARELSQAHIFLFPTRSDNSPNSVKEAVVAGVPVVASEVGGLIDYVIPQKNGVLFESENLESFKAAIRQATQHPLLGRGRVDASTHERLREYLSPHVMAEKFRSAYSQVLRSKGFPGLSP